MIADDLGRRRDRTYAYLKLWGIETDLTLLPIVRSPGNRNTIGADFTTDVASSVGTDLRTAAEVCGRAGATALVALKAQGLSQLETFAFADAYQLWDSLTVEENDFVLDADPPPSDLVRNAWQFEQTFVFEWALGLVAHLRFPDAEVNNGRVTELLMTRILAVAPGDQPTVRTPKELADAADVAFALQALGAAPIPAGGSSPAGMVRSVAEERAAAFRWLLAH